MTPFRLVDTNVQSKGETPITNFAKEGAIHNHLTWTYCSVEITRPFTSTPLGAGRSAYGVLEPIIAAVFVKFEELNKARSKG
jgi:hypothetical protein